MSGHTPGPWKTDIQSNQFSDDGVIADICGRDGDTIARLTTKFHIGGRQMPRSEWSANAKLMATAPDLLEALREIVAETQDGGQPPNRVRDSHIHSTAQLAIEKVEGSQS